MGKENRRAENETVNYTRQKLNKILNLQLLLNKLLIMQTSFTKCMFVES